MGFWRNVLYGSTGTVGIQSPYAPTDALTTFVAAEVLGAMSDAGAVTREVALKVPGLKRAHGIHCGTTAKARWFVVDATGAPIANQPGWITSSGSGLSPYHRMFGIASDLFMSGWACLGITADGDDAAHIPNGLWGVNTDGSVAVDGSIPAKYHARPVVIPLGYGENGVLNDGADVIRAARAIERAWTERVENPIPATDLHITDPAYNGLTKREKRKIVDEWNENRRRSGGQTAVTQSFLEVRALGQVSADLFEKGRNASRLDQANHAGVPASIIEGSADSGGSDIEYSNETTKRNELYDFGSSLFINAIEARLSLDDVVAPGLSVRADLAHVMAAPTPGTNPPTAD